MKYRLRILPAADTDIDEAAAYIASDSLDQALRLYDSVDATFRLLREQPERWPVYKLDHPRLQGVRRCWVAGFPNFLVFYRVEGSVVECCTEQETFLRCFARLRLTSLIEPHADAWNAAASYPPMSIRICIPANSMQAAVA
jgi:plasmid stabilization system protein ParE